MSGKTPNHLPLAMHYVRAAIELDNGGKTKVCTTIESYHQELVPLIEICSSLKMNVNNYSKRISKLDEHSSYLKLL